MSLIQHLISEGKEDIIRNKIGLEKDLADALFRDFKKYKKYWIPMAHIMKQTGNSTWHYNTVLRLFYHVKRLQELPNSPTIDFNEWKNHLTTRALVEVEMERIIGVIDYMVGAQPTPNLSNVSYEEAVRRAQAWHDQLEATGKQLDTKEGQVLIHTFDDGYYWLDLKTSKCQDEGDAMGHCANTRADTLLSLRDKNGEPHVTVAYNYDGVFTQMKGKQNKPPNEKYHEYIVKLFDRIVVDNTAYQFIRYNPEYKKEDDFSLLDLSQDLLKQVHEYMDEEMFYEMFYKMFSYNKFLEENDMMRSDNNSLIISDITNIFPFDREIGSYNIGTLNEIFKSFTEEFGDDYISKKFIEHGGSEKLNGMEFITVIHFFNIDRKETDLIADALIESKSFFLVSVKVSSTTLAFIFAK